MVKALVAGAGGFIGHHLVRYLKSQGYWVRAVDVKIPEFGPSEANQFLILDLRNPIHCNAALSLEGGFDEVYQLAADMGGMGYILDHECEIMHNNALVNLNMIDAAARSDVGRYFFSSSVCVYRDMKIGESMLGEWRAIPANPHNEYGWEKLYAERMALAYARHRTIQVRIGRFQNCYGPEGTWQGGREKAPAALCRKAIEAKEGGAVEVWGDGTAVRSYTYIDDMLRGIHLLMRSELEGPVNIGCEEQITVGKLARTIIEVSGKDLHIEHVGGPVGVQSRNFSKVRIHSLGWESKVSLEDGISTTYSWIKKEIHDWCDHLR